MIVLTKRLKAKKLKTKKVMRWCYKEDQLNKIKLGFHNHFQITQIRFIDIYIQSNLDISTFLIFKIWNGQGLMYNLKIAIDFIKHLYNIYMNEF